MWTRSGLGVSSHSCGCSLVRLVADVVSLCQTAGNTIVETSFLGEVNATGSLAPQKGAQRGRPPAPVVGLRLIHCACGARVGENTASLSGPARPGLTERLSLRLWREALRDWFLCPAAERADGLCVPLEQGCHPEEKEPDHGGAVSKFAQDPSRKDALGRRRLFTTLPLATRAPTVPA